MLFTSFFLVFSFGLAFGAPSATVPGPGDTYAEGGNCTIAWIADNTGLWSAMNIELMTGPNSPMIHLRTIATVDAQKTTSFSWPCPAVYPNSAIYFYQFSSQQDQANTNWATRFLIAAADGTSTPPTNVSSTGIPYGFGSLVDPTMYNAPPAYLLGNGQIIGTPSNTPSGTVSPSVTPSATPSATSNSLAPSLSSTPHTLSTSSTSFSPSSTSNSSTSTSTPTKGSNNKATLNIDGPSSWFIASFVSFLGTVAISLL